MSGETEENVSGWTPDQLRFHYGALREADLRFQAERDLRYKEVALEREKALKIKETADLAALQLAREIQTYKDEKANELRSQIERERGTYATHADLKGLSERLDAQLAPLITFVAGQQARGQGAVDTRAIIALVVAVVVALVGIAAFVTSRI